MEISEKEMVIYKITNNINGKCYIGQTVNYKERIRQHKETAFRKNGAGRDRPLYRAIRKYGLENFSFKIIDHATSIDELNEKEIYWIKECKSCVDDGNGYNLEKGGHNGLKCEETKRKIKEANSGENSWCYGKRGSECHNAKKVINLTTGEKFDSLIDCAIHDFGDRKYMKQISAACNPNTNKLTVKGYRYAILDNKNNPIIVNKKRIPFNHKISIIDEVSGKSFQSIKEASCYFGVTESFIRDRIYGRVKKDKFVNKYNFKIADRKSM